MDNFVNVARLAEKQGGVVSRPQVLGLGFHKSVIVRDVAQGLLIRQLKGVYRLASTKVTRETHLWAALLWAGDGAVLSHLTAGWLWKLEGLGKKPSNIIEVSVPVTRQLVDLPTVRAYRVRTLAPVKDFATLGGFPCTSLARTLIDLSKTLSPSALEHAHDSAVRRSPENRTALFEALKRLGTGGRHRIANLVEIASRDELGCTQSWLENEVRQSLRRASIRVPLPQLAINDDDGKRIGIFDFAWPEARVVIAVDSWEHHGPREGFEKDRVQWSQLSAIGWRTIPVTYRRLVNDEAGFLRELKQAIGQGV